MFENVKPKEVGKITSIPFSAGIEYILSIVKAKEPYEFSNTFTEKRTKKEKTYKGMRYENVRLINWNIKNKKELEQSQVDILQSIELESIMNLDLPTTLSNELVIQIQKLKIQENQQFSILKKLTDNEFKPELIVKKL